MDYDQEEDFIANLRLVKRRAVNHDHPFISLPSPLIGTIFQFTEKGNYLFNALICNKLHEKYKETINPVDRYISYKKAAENLDFLKLSTEFIVRGEEFANALVGMIHASAFAGKIESIRWIMYKWRYAAIKGEEINGSNWVDNIDIVNQCEMC